MQASCHLNLPAKIAEATSMPLIPASTAGESGVATPLGPLELESLVLNIDASLRVHARHQMFGWTQGMLQNLLKHDVLVCALRSDQPSRYQADTLAGPAIDQALVSELFQQSSSLVAHLVKNWEESEFHPVCCAVKDSGPFAGSALAAEFRRAGAPNLALHGTYDSFGEPASLFLFAAAPGALGPRQASFIELIVPFLHLAWMRTQLNRSRDDIGPATSQVALLTRREQEILRWIHLGKSNYEIGTILQISPLTVKNHVQKILRKLNVQNRTGAVGKALALRLLKV